jgi:CheY-like chemotaxis protein
MINEVWIIDDDLIFKRILNFLFRQNSQYKNVVEFGHGLEAKKQLENRLRQGMQLPDVILIDTNMPIMSGTAFLTWLKKEVEALDDLILPYIYLMSSSNISDEIKKNENYSILSGFIEKPLKKEHLELIAQRQVSIQ